MSLGLRVAAVVLPGAAAAAAAFIAARLVPAPVGGASAAWWIWLLLISTGVAFVVERLARHLLPLAVLLQLSLAFPDQAPSRFAMARGAGNTRRLEERIQTAKARGIDDDPSRAARQILELVAALSAHDRKTRGHSERVRAYTDMLADEMGLDPDDRDRLRWAALLHDIGKLEVPKRILNKAGKPDPHEWERLKEHPAEGARLASPLADWLGEWAATIPQHHERVDGRGYPQGLTGTSISLGARVVAVADSFEVMTAARTYKRPMTVPAARRELASCAGTQFDEDVVRAFFSISLGRLWWTVGPASWVAVAPVLGWLQRSGAQLAIAGRSAAVVASLGVGGVVQAPAAVASPGPPAASPIAGAPTSAEDDIRGDEPLEPGRDDGSGGEPGGADATDDGASDSGGSGGTGGTGTGSTGGTGTGGSGGSGDEPEDSGSLVDDVVDSVRDPVKSAVDDAVSTVEETVDGVLDPVDGATGTVTGAVTGTITGTLEGLGGI